MAHPEQQVFCKSVQSKFPDYFVNKKVLDCGSLDINGNNRYLFTNCEYIGLDVGPGKNVDVISPIHLYEAPDESYDFIISTECFEHDKFYPLSLKNIVRMLKSKGMFLFTCASYGRPEHGTKRTGTAGNSPLTAELEEFEDYYKNLNIPDIKAVLDVNEIFDKHEFSGNFMSHDLYFWGIKK